MKQYQSVMNVLVREGNAMAHYRVHYLLTCQQKSDRVSTDHPLQIPKKASGRRHMWYFMGRLIRMPCPRCRNQSNRKKFALLKFWNYQRHISLIAQIFFSSIILHTLSPLTNHASILGSVACLTWSQVLTTRQMYMPSEQLAWGFMLD